MRVRNGATKAALIIAGYALAVVVGITVEVSTYPGWGVVAGCAVVLALVLILSRLFRGENESDAPRPWWRMTAYPTAGYVLAVWFFVQAIGSASAGMLTTGFAGWVSGIVS